MLLYTFLGKWIKEKKASADDISVRSFILLKIGIFKK